MSFEPNLKRRIVKEAANLLYLGIEKEYKQAKEKAAKTFGSRSLPSNIEIALELDLISEEREGESRKENLVKKRIESLRIMKILEDYNPLLIGSVWRGNINQKSDIDIIVYNDTPQEILFLLKKKDFQISRTKRVSVTKKGISEGSYHIYTTNLDKKIVEISVRNQDQIYIVKKCDVFGDNITGLKIKELEKIINNNP
ncbi:MAG: hypothetical protein KGD70_14170, partial [Candidatus Lokiarchaeota archaeon]|nr:hypothetical protein [Candidatus Lokiarchaeota archaeon]